MRVAALIAILALAAAADASRVNVNGLRALLTDYREHEEHEEPKYCKDWEEHSDCPEYYECVALEKKFCKSERVCTKDKYKYGKQTCRYEEVCYDYHCVEKPRYCDPYAKDDECKKEYGYGWECEKLDKKECKYKDECKKHNTGKCKEYDYEDKCHDVKGRCKSYAQKKECKKQKVCVEFKQEKKCDKQKVCKAYKEIKHCKKNHKCAEYNAYSKCVRYGEDCTYQRGDCKEYEYKEHCHYYPTKQCIKYDDREDCKHVDTHCKEYEQEKKCEKVQKGCKAYEYEEKCEKVEDVCWHGKCEKKPPPPPKYHAPEHTHSHHGSSYGAGR